MRTFNEDDAKNLSKLALLASAAATAALVISETRVLRRITAPSQARPARQPEAAAAAPSAAEPQQRPAPGAPDLGDQPKPSHHRDDADDAAPPPPSSPPRVRFRARRPASERLHYGLPVRHRHRRSPTAAVSGREAAARSSEAPLAPPPGVDAEFDAEYLALVEAITHDGRVDDGLDDAGYLAIVEAIVRDGEIDEGDRAARSEAIAPPAARENRDPTDDEVWWLPAPRLQYIFAALIYVAAAAAAGSDPVAFAIEGVGALTTVDSTADLLLLGWVLCGLIVLAPLDAIANRLVALASRGRLDLAELVSRDSLDSAGWGLRVLATSAFVAGVVLYTPHALGWALDTDYPVAAVSSSSMSPALDEGELVLIDGVGSVDELRVGDIIAFRHERGIAVRRIAGFRDGAAMTKADALPEESLTVPFEAIAGRVLTVGGTQVKLPLLGNISLLGERTVEPGGATTALP